MRRCDRSWPKGACGTCGMPSSLFAGSLTHGSFARQGRETFADLVVVATTHPGPALPVELRGLSDDPRLVAEPLADGALDRVSDSERVLVVGSGLTAADIIATLDARGHRGRIVMISRRGLRSLGHPPRPFPPEGNFLGEPARSATELLVAVRRALRRATAAGRTWHPVFDALRAQGEGIWRALTPDARRRIVRHLRPFWDIHRFRIAPQIDAVLERRLADGSLELRKARLGRAQAEADDISIDLRDVRRNATTRERFDTIVVATGPRPRRHSSAPALSQRACRRRLCRARRSGPRPAHLPQWPGHRRLGPTRTNAVHCWTARAGNLRRTHGIAAGIQLRPVRRGRSTRRTVQGTCSAECQIVYGGRIRHGAGSPARRLALHAMSGAGRAWPGNPDLMSGRFRKSCRHYSL